MSFAHALSTLPSKSVIFGCYHADSWRSNRKNLAQFVTTADFERLRSYHHLKTEEELADFIRFCENHESERVRSKFMHICQ